VIQNLNTLLKFFWLPQKEFSSLRCFVFVPHRTSTNAWWSFRIWLKRASRVPPVQYAHVFRFIEFHCAPGLLSRLQTVLFRQCGNVNGQILHSSGAMTFPFATTNRSALKDLSRLLSCEYRGAPYSEIKRSNRTSHFHYQTRLQEVCLSRETITMLAITNAFPNLKHY